MSVPSYNHNCDVPTALRVPISYTHMCKKLACNGDTLNVLATIISVVQSAVFDWNFEGLFLQGGCLLLGKMPQM